jgi:hypothetical protein
MGYTRSTNRQFTPLENMLVKALSAKSYKEILARDVFSLT